MKQKKRNVVQGLWIGNELSVMEQLSIASFLKHGHEYHLYVYQDVANLPQGAVLKDGEEIVPRAQVFVDEELTSSYANFSDVFRYKLLFEKGGFWSDMDIICLRPFDFQSEFVFGSEATLEGSEERTRFGPTLVNGNVIKVPIGSEIMKSCYDLSVRGASVERAWWELGPPLITEAVKKFQLNQYIFPPFTFNAVNWWNWDDIISDKLRARIRIKSTLLFRRPVYAVHLWNSMWRRAATDKNIVYSRKCLYEKLKRLNFRS